ncbi:MAG TPA: alanine--tRNA ligase [Anaerolineaceae bacterium]
MEKQFSGSQIRQTFIDFFLSKKHTFVPSSSLVPGGDQTLLFTNAGMVQFKDVFLGTDQRPYTRAVNSQKCMRVAGKHNDLDDVGRDDTHHTFFEMLGNWSFGDYYKKEAIAWAWELLTEVWGLDRDRLWATCFKDDKGNIPADDEAAEYWKQQPGMDSSHVLYFGRKDNFWEMADVGPCGPCSEIHFDRGAEFCDKKGVPGHICGVNGDCKRFLELWNLVFIQYNRQDANHLDPLPACHVDTGMGFERIVSVLQGVTSNYRTDLLMPLLDKTMELTGQSPTEREANITPYRVIADHARAAAFLIADGVVPGNTGRNYICRMIIRRASRFGGKLGLKEPFLAKVAEVVIQNYGSFYHELVKNRNAILTSITREEERFQKTVEVGLSQLEDLLADLKAKGETVLDGRKAFELYATNGLPLELARDVAREQGTDVDEVGFRLAMEEHRLASGAGKAFGALGGEDVDVYRAVLEQLVSSGSLPESGVSYDPYNANAVEGSLLAIVRKGQTLERANEGDLVDIILPSTCFYVESGGQVSDTGTINGCESDWEIAVEEMRRPAAGVITHIGRVVRGIPKVGDRVIARIDEQRRLDIMRNHTATHLLHAQLHKVIGEHARQAGSLVAPDRLRFDFNHPEALTSGELEQIEWGVNEVILHNLSLKKTVKPLSEAVDEGATALFGEKYGDTVRTIKIGETSPISYELCGGTHVDETGEIGLFLIISEGSAAAGIRRIEAVTGRKAYELLFKRIRALKTMAGMLSCGWEDAPDKLEALITLAEQSRKEVNTLQEKLAVAEFLSKLPSTVVIRDVPVLSVIISGVKAEILRNMTDLFRQKFPGGVVALGSIVEGKPVIIVSVDEVAVKRGINAGEIARQIAVQVGGSGGGKPTMAQAGGKDPGRLPEAMHVTYDLVKAKLS